MADYPWDKCIADQIDRYGDEETARKVCGMIRAKYGKSVSSTKDVPPIVLADDFDMESCLAAIEKELSLTPKQKTTKFWSELIGLKSGARHSALDQDHINQAKDKAKAISDHMDALGADAEYETQPTEESGKSILSGDLLIAFGDEIKQTDDHHYQGYLVRFSTSDDADLDNDYFTKETDYGIKSGAKTPVFFNHRLPIKTRDGRGISVKQKIGEGTLTIDDVGVFIDAILYNRDEYEKAISRMAHKQGWSSGTAPHLVDRKKVGRANQILSWPLGLDASITPKPAEPRNSIIGIKSYSDSNSGQSGSDDPIAQSNGRKDSPMADGMNADEIKALRDDFAALKKQNDELLVELKKPALQNLPQITGAKDLEAEKPFKNLGEQLFFIKEAAINPSKTDKRLLAINEAHTKSLKATGASEATGADAGFLLQQEFSNEALGRMYTTGEVMQRVTRRTVGPGANGIVVNVINETSRADGSRFGGVQAYWLNEGGTKTASRPSYRRFPLNLEKLVGLYYATDELLQDLVAMEGEVSDAFSKEIMFKAEDACFNGSGAGLPLGILNAAATISIAKEAGQAANTIVYQNLVKMWARQWAASRANSAWFINQDVEPQLDQLSLAVGTGGIDARYVTYGPDGVMRIKNRPVIPVEYCATLGTVGDIILADMSQYRWIDKGAVKQDVSIHVQFLTDETAFRWVYRCNGAPFWNAALTPKNGSNTLSPFITLATRA